MDNALAIDELLIRILQHCNTQTLGRVALVCRTFRDVAMPILWSELDDLAPLFTLLPVVYASPPYEAYPESEKQRRALREQSFYYFKSMCVSDHEQSLQRNCKLYSPDMIAFKRFAPLVRSVQLFDPTLISSGLWAALTLMCPSGVLLPNLIHLGTMLLSPSPDGSISSVELGLLLSEKLQRFFISAEAEVERIGEDLVEFLGVLAQRAPYIQELRMDCGPAENLSTVVDGLSDLFGCLLCLKTIYLCIHDERSPTLLASLLHLPQLEDLHIELPVFEDHGSLFQELPPPFHGGYRGVKPMNHLEISSEARVFGRILFWIGKLNVEFLTHTSHTLSTEADMSLLIQSVLATSTPALNSFAILLAPGEEQEDFLDTYNEYPDDYQYNLSTFRPLLDISSLVTLKIQTFVPLSFGEDFLRGAAAAWPSLESLYLCPYPMHEEMSNGLRPHLTMQAVLAFVARCPKLSSLGILFDASTVRDMDEPFPVSAEETRHLAVLDVGKSWIDSQATRTVAGVLAQYFPALTRLAWHGSGDLQIQTVNPVDLSVGTPCLHDGEAGYRQCVHWNEMLRLLPGYMNANGQWRGIQWNFHQTILPEESAKNK